MVAPRLGERSQVWIDRQIRGFEAFRPAILTWPTPNSDAPQEHPVPIECLPFPKEPNDGRGRWLWRTRNAGSGNFFGTRGGERRQICRFLRNHDVEVMLAHFGHIALRVLPAARDLGIPVVAHFHGLDITSSLNNRWYRWSLKNKICDFAEVVCVGSHQRDRLIRMGAPEDRIHLIPCGVPVADFPFVDRVARGDCVTLLFVGRLVPWKGVQVVLRALSALDDDLPAWEFRIVGTGPQQGELQELAGALGLSDRVRFLGSLDSSEVNRQMAGTDIFVHHSLTSPDGWVEGFGVSVAEAASTGLPVVASRSGGICDQVREGETGILTEENDVQATARAISTLMRDGDLRLRMGAAGATRMRDVFDTQGQVRKLESVLLRAASSNSDTGHR
ncbi:MAG: glycosyltransferase [Planctomycetota bacterium]